MIETSNCDVTYSAHQIQMTTICHWMNPPWKFSAYATASDEIIENKGLICANLYFSIAMKMARDNQNG